MDANARKAVMTFFLDKLQLLKERSDKLKEDTERTLTEYRIQSYELQKLLQEICDHSSLELISDCNYHNNVDDSYTECKICGKRIN